MAAILALANEVVSPERAETDRAAYLEELGFSTFDALHSACAERGTVEVFLTTDDNLLRRAGRHKQLLRIRVENPLSWYQELPGCRRSRK